LKEAYEVEKVGKQKYEVYTRYGVEKGRSRKIIIVEYPDEIFVITGSEGE